MSVVLLLLCVVFFFKQKTAYEMRISDWSSDVCSSDLHHHGVHHGGPCGDLLHGGRPRPGLGGAPGSWVGELRPWLCIGTCCTSTPASRRRWPRASASRRSRRSEEHTSELQSLMRISYAVFCLKKKTQLKSQQHTQHERETYHYHA